MFFFSIFTFYNKFLSIYHIHFLWPYFHIYTSSVINSLAKVMLPNHKKRKIGSKTSDCMFIRYASNSEAYRFLVLKSDVLECNTIIETKKCRICLTHFSTF